MMLLQHVRRVARILISKPGFSVAVIMTLALGIGATTTIFSLISGVLLKPLPYSDPHRLVLMWERMPRYENASVAYPNFVDWRNQNTVFQDLAAFRPSEVNLTGRGNATKLSVYQVSGSLFDVLGVEPLLGRDFLADDDRRGARPVAILSSALWQGRFAGDRNVLGEKVVLDDRPFTVVGVMPPDLVFPPFETSVDLWVPIEQSDSESLRSRGQHPAIEVVGRLKPEATLARARADMETIARRLEQQYPATNTGSRVNLAPIYDRALGETKAKLALLFCAVAFVLLISCANVANLLLARATARDREMAVRAALGASRGRIARLVLTECLMLWMLGGLAGVLLANQALPSIAVWFSDSLPRMDEVRVDGSVLTFALGTSLLTGFLFGLLPALRLSRPDLQRALRNGRGTLAGPGGHRLRRRLVVGELTLAQALLVVAGLIIRSFMLMAAEDPGLEVRNLLTLRLSLPETRYPEMAQRHAFFNRLREAVERLPGVVSAAVGGPIPLGGGGWQNSYHAEGDPPAPPGQNPMAEVCAASPAYHRTLGIPLLRGRYFDERDIGDAPRVAIVDETFAARHWPQVDPIGRRVKFGGHDSQSPWMTVVGVVGHVKTDGVARESLVELYIPFEHDEDDTWSLILRTEGEPTRMVERVRRVVLDMDAEQPISDVRTMEDYLAGTTAPHRTLGTLLGAFAGLALLLAAVGIYGVMSCYANERRHEIGVRMALGAERGRVLRMLVRQGAVTAAIGVGLGTLVALAAARVMSAELYGVGPADPSILALASFSLGGVALLAIYMPARRAATADPLETLRHE